MAMKHSSLSVAHKVKEIIESFETDRIFSTQELLSLIGFGSRNSLDLALSRLVKYNVIKRLARGVFAMSEVAENILTPYAVAKVKAKAFGNSIQLSGIDAVKNIKITHIETDNPEHDHTYTFYTSGSSSSFKYGSSLIKFVSASHRKRDLPNDLSGIVLKAVWHAGRSKEKISRPRAKYMVFNQKPDEIKVTSNTVSLIYTKV